MLKSAAMVHARTAAPQRPREYKSYPSLSPTASTPHCSTTSQLTWISRLLRVSLPGTNELGLEESCSAAVLIVDRTEPRYTFPTR